MKTPNKSTIETVKTVVIVALIVGIAAFVGGMKYQSHVNGQVKNEAKNIVSLKQ